jgi:hypothetical protein
LRDFIRWKDATEWNVRKYGACPSIILHFHFQGKTQKVDFQRCLSVSDVTRTQNKHRLVMDQTLRMSLFMWFKQRSCLHCVSGCQWHFCSLMFARSVIPSYTFLRSKRGKLIRLGLNTQVL